MEFEFQWALVKGLVFRCKFNKFLLVKINKYIYKFLKFIFKKNYNYKLKSLWELFALINTKNKWK